MKQWRCAWLLAGAMLLLCGQAAPVDADITSSTSNWESPVNNQEISGIQIIRGFVYSTSGATVSVTLRVVSPVAVSFAVPWGSARTDVGPTPPQLNSGFGFTTNVNGLPPGPATLELEFREGTGSGPCAAPTCLTLTRTVTIAKPGGRAGESAQLFSFLTDLNPTGARLALAGRDIFVTPVTVIDSGAGGTRQSTLVLRWFQNSQSFGVVSAASDTSFTNVQGIFTSRCVSCHSGPTPPASLNLSAGGAFANLVPIVSTEDASRYRIRPGSAAVSYLYQKIIPGGAITGDRMPFGCSGSGCLSQSDIDTIGNWINAGAAPPQ